ncbi:MAG: tetratricopeptide repeat protein [Deltaproteobacteria bacterium]|nr:tetratricopeptide repeat protein [Deltaproteobacteria bacterium]
MLLLATLAHALADAPEGAGPDLADPAVREATQLDVLDALLDAGMAEQALEMVSEMRKAGSFGVRLDVAQARAMHMRGLATDATELLLGVVKKHPREASAWSQLGVVYADGGKLDEAETALRRAAKLAPGNADIQNNLGFVLLSARENEAAIDAFRAALKIDPASRRTRNNLGFALVRLDRYDEALEAFRAANAEPDARYNFGVACESAGDRAGAITSYQAAVSAQPGHPQAAAALTRLLQEY